jgi:hypothetical protein
MEHLLRFIRRLEASPKILRISLIAAASLASVWVDENNHIICIEAAVVFQCRCVQISDDPLGSCILAKAKRRPSTSMAKMKSMGESESPWRTPRLCRIGGSACPFRRIRDEAVASSDAIYHS